MFGFNPEKPYRPSDPEMRQIASPGQLAQWRHLGRTGPPFIRVGSKIFYAGGDLIRWLEENRVEPAAA